MMTETKDDIAAERDRLRDENDQLRSQLAAAAIAAAGQPAGVVAPQHTFQLSEGDRQALAMNGAVNVGGRMRTAAEVREMLGEDQAGVDLGNAPVPEGLTTPRQSAVEGVDFVYPSVAPGKLDPDVAGRPGVSGPAAEDE